MPRRNHAGIWASGQANPVAMNGDADTNISSRNAVQRSRAQAATRTPIGSIVTATTRNSTNIAPRSRTGHPKNGKTTNTRNAAPATNSGNCASAFPAAKASGCGKAWPVGACSLARPTEKVRASSTTCWITISSTPGIRNAP